MTNDEISNTSWDAPITRGEHVISFVQLRRPNAGELRDIKLTNLLRMDVGVLSTLLPRISSPALTAADVAKQDPADLASIATEMGGFFLSKAQKHSFSV